MALQPQDRPSGSSQVLRFIGTVVAGEDLPTFPKTNGTFTIGGAVGDVRGVRLMLADTTNLKNMARQLPRLVFDDAQPAGAAPHDPIATGLTALVVNAGEQAIGVGGANAAMRTWTQNTWVIAKGLSANLGSVDTENAIMVLDTLSSGLGLNSGLPVLILPVTLTGSAVASFDVDILVEVRSSPTR